MLSICSSDSERDFCLLGLIFDMIRGAEMSTYELLAMFAGIAVGLIIGLAAGLRVRRDIMDGAEELIAQINELQGK